MSNKLLDTKNWFKGKKKKNTDTSTTDLFLDLRRFLVKINMSLSHQKRIQMYRDLSSHIGSTDLDDALTALQKEAEALGSNELLMYEEIQIGLKEQRSFYTLISQWIPRDEALQIYIAKQGRGDSANALPRAIESARNICEKKGEIFALYASKMAYPLVMLILAGFMFYGFKVYGYEFLIEIKPFNKWPLDAQTKYKSIAFVTDNIILIASSLVLFVYSVIRFMKKGEGKFRAACNRIPPFSIYQSVTSYTILMSLAALTRSGVQLAESLRLISSALDGWAKTEILEMIDRLERPINLEEDVTLTEYAFNSALFTKLVRVKVGSYARRDDFVENLDYLNSVLMNSVKTESTRGAAIIGGLLIFGVMGFIVQIAIVFFSAVMGGSSPLG